MNIWERLGTLDRRWIYTLVWIMVVIPFIFPTHFPIEITPEVRQLYEAVEALPDSSVVLLTFDYYPSTIAETMPMSRAALRHLFRKNCRVITMTTVPLGGPTMERDVTRQEAERAGKTYGVDYVNLGYKANYVAVLQGMGSSIESIYPSDAAGTPLSEIPLMRDVKNYDDIAFIFAVSDNAIVDYWISIVEAQYHVPVGAGVTAVVAPKYYAYVGSGQMTGLLGGMRGAAEYEQLVGYRGRAFSGMGSQSLVHFLIVALVIVGNVSYFMARRRRERSA